MIEIVYDRKKLHVAVKGHAHSDEKGKDLVCAAASIIVYTLAANVEKLCEDKSRVRRPHIVLAEGNAAISCSPIHGMSAVTTLIFDSICVGFELLQQKYPEYVRYTVLQG